MEKNISVGTALESGSSLTHSVGRANPGHQSWTHALESLNSHWNSGPAVWKGSVPGSEPAASYPGQGYYCLLAPNLFPGENSHIFPSCCKFPFLS